MSATLPIAIVNIIMKTDKKNKISFDHKFLLHIVAAQVTFKKPIHDDGINANQMYVNIHKNIKIHFN